MRRPETGLPSYKMSTADWSLLLLMSVQMGAAFLFIKIILKELPPLTTVFLRVGLAAIILLAAVWIRGYRLPRKRSDWQALITVALLNNVVGFSLFAYGQQYITGGLAAIFQATTPIWTIIAAHLCGSERITAGRAVGVALGFAGTVVIMGGSLFHDLGAGAAAQIACLVGAFAYAFAGLFGAKLANRHIPSLVAAAVHAAVAAAVLLPFVLVLDQPWRLPPPSAMTWSAVAGLVILSTCGMFFLYFHLLMKAGATNALLVSFLLPVTAILLGVSILGETLMPRHYWGMALIAAGFLAIDERLPKAARLRRAPLSSP